MKIVKIAVEAEGGTAQGGVQISVKYGIVIIIIIVNSYGMVAYSIKSTAL